MKLPVFRDQLSAQFGGTQDAISNDGGLDCGPVVLTREEDAASTDINLILQRAGAIPVQRVEPMFGSQDFKLELRDHLDAVRAAAEAWTMVPLSVRQRYRNWSELDEAVAQGHVKFGDPPKEPVPDPKPLAVRVVPDPEEPVLKKKPL